MNWTYNDYELTDDPERIDIDMVLSLLSETYWANARTREQIETISRSCICFSLYYRGQQIGFFRALTDGAVCTYLMDFIVHPAHRGNSIGAWILDIMLAYPAFAGTKFVLLTRDAQSLYRRAGFITHPFECMIHYGSSISGQQINHKQSQTTS